MSRMTELQYNTAKLAIAAGAKPKRLAEIINADAAEIDRVANTVNYQQYIIDDTPTENILPQYWDSIGNEKTKGGK